MKALWASLINTFHRLWGRIRGLFGKRTIEEVVKRLSPKQVWRLTWRLIDTSRGGFNMPKYQPCPQCKGWRKRRQKTQGGAIYYCHSDKISWLVKHSSL